MAKFSGGKLNKKNGVLSYKYAAKPGGKENNIYIKQDGGDWYFVDKQGKVRDTLADGGKLSSTHINNLKGTPGSSEENIFASAKVNPETGGIVPKSVPKSIGPRGNVDTSVATSPAEAKLPADLVERGNLRLAKRGASSVETPAVTSNVNAPSAGSTNYQEFTGGPVTASGYGNSGVPAAVPSVNNSVRELNQSQYEVRSPENFDASSNVSFVQGEMPSAAAVNEQTQNQGMGEYADKQQFTKGGYGGGSDPGFFQEGSAGDFRQYTGGQTDFSNLDAAMAPGLDQKNLTIGEGGDPGLYQIDDDFYRTKDGTLMKDGGWFTGDTAATQADIDAGIKDQASPGMTSAEGWQAAGSVMKGVGGLASAYTGMKNYQLARDAHNAQKNQWQANYNQQLKAYKDNKIMANNEIDARNRVLASRGQAESYNTIT